MAAAVTVHTMLLNDFRKIDPERPASDDEQPSDGQVVKKYKKIDSKLNMAVH